MKYISVTQFNFLFKTPALLFSILFCSVFLLSCDPEEDNIDPLDELVGIWDITTLSITNCNDPNDNSASRQGIIGCVTDNGMESCTTAALTLELNGDATTTFTSTLRDLATGQSQTQTEEQNSTFSIDGNEITICTDGDCETFTYSVAGTTLSVDGSDASNGCSTSFSATKRS